MKLSIIIPVMNQHQLTTACLDIMTTNLSNKEEIEIIVLDNGSDIPYCYSEQVKVIRYENSIGVYPTFWEGLKYSTGDIIAFFHSDMIVSENNWDQRVLNIFEKDNKLGLLGFIGSNEIDYHGGRGLGTTSNFEGSTIKHGDKEWKGSHALVHGKQNSGFTKACVVDGCAMIFRRIVLEQIEQRKDFPPHHFYDRLLSCEVLEKGYTVGVLGIACDHISGQTVNQEPKYQEMAVKWLVLHFGIIPENLVNTDQKIYLEAEKQWLNEYRDQKHFIPKKIS